MSKKFFDYVIGNPPYQEDRQGESTTALPVYHYFIDAAYKVGSAVELIHPARFLFDAGRTPKEWNRKMLNDTHLKVLDYQADGSMIFPGTDIKGGIAITYHDNEKDFGHIGVFTTSPYVNSILNKVQKKDETPFSKITFVATKFNTDNLFQDFSEYNGHERRMSSNVLSFKCFHKKKTDEDIMIYGVLNNKRVKKYIDKKYVDLSDSNIFKYKIVTPKADGNGSFGAEFTNPEIIECCSGFTHTFLGIGGFDTEEEAEAVLKYIKSKFARTLLSILKITQDLNADKWKYVPLQDFTSSSDIDWSKSIHEIDLQLYKKYGLSEDEINFIETNVKEMA